jgi:HD-like signal output (HDOD) protein
LRAKASQGESESYFAAGLLRDIGLLVLGPLLAQRHLRIGAATTAKDHDIQAQERRILGFDHCWVGERVADRWSLPANLKLCIVHHHRIPATASMEELRLLASVRLAERLVYASGVGVTKDHPFDARLDPLLIQASGLGAARFEELVRDLPQIIKASEMSA